MREKCTYGEITTVPGVGGSHHVFGIKHLLGELGNSDGAVLLASTSGQRGVTSHEEVESWERNHVDGQLPQVGVELTREAQASGNSRHDDRHKVVEVAVCWGCQLEGAEANIVQSLIVDTEGLVRILNELVYGEGGVVRLRVDTSHGWTRARVTKNKPRPQYRKPWGMGQRSR